MFRASRRNAQLTSALEQSQNPVDCERRAAFQPIVDEDCETSFFAGGNPMENKPGTDLDFYGRFPNQPSLAKPPDSSGGLEKI
jgi:hypothetical protein